MNCTFKRSMIVNLLNLFFIVGIVGAAPSENIQYLNQGWSPTEFKKMSSWNFGAQLMPANWFLAMERNESTELFSKDLNRFGFIEQNQALPVGVTMDENQLTAKLYGEKKWVGVNCTACHTSLLNLGGQKVIINGNQSQLRLQAFEEGILDSLSATLQSDDKFQRFSQRIGSTHPEQLKKYMQLFVSEFGAWNRLNHKYFDPQGREVRWGVGRIDGLGGSTNDLTCRLSPRMSWPLLEAIFVDKENCGPSHAPVSIPYLWGMTNQEFAQWNGEVHSSIGRNVGAMMSGYGKNWVEPTILGTPKVMTTIKIADVGQVEEYYKKLKAPEWSEIERLKIGDRLDEAKVAQGRIIFQNNCQSCHSVNPQLTAPNKFGNRYWKFPLFPVSMIGTDEAYTRDELNHRTFINPLAVPIYLAMNGFSNISLDRHVPAFAARGLVPGAAILNFFFENSYLPADIDQISNCRENRQPEIFDGIKAKSLEGVLFTAPYLHNGSVPDIYALLTPASERPKKFFIGCENYSLEKFGFDCRGDEPNSFEFDTTLHGNSSKGHEYGTQLNMSEKIALVEFIKSLKQPAFVPGNPECY